MSETTFDRKAHWEEVYRTRSVEDVSWFQPDAALSLRLIEESGVERDAPILDAGGGASRLIDALLGAGYSNLSVLDISGAALAASQRRLGEAASRVVWYEQDVTAFAPPHRFALWHDRAVFHFLTDPADRARYLAVLERALLPGAHLIIAAFALDGPTRCSNLEVVRYDADSLAGTLGSGFSLLRSLDEEHVTPAGKVQKFGYFCFAKKP